MHPEFEKLLPRIEARLSCENIAEFKIGITGQEIEDRLNGDDYRGYHKITLIASGSNSNIIQAEKDYVDYFQNKSDKCKCNNSPNDAGNGNIHDADKLYVVVKFNFSKPTSIADLQIIHLDLFDFEPIKL